MFGEITPLAPAFIGSLAGVDTLFAFLGSLFAFALKGQLYESLPTLSAMAAIGVFRFFLGAYSGKGAKWLNLISALLTAVSVGIITGITVIRPSDIIMAAVSAITAGTVAYCLIITYGVLAGGYMTAVMKPSGVVAPGIVMVFTAAVLSGITSVLEFAVNGGVLFGTVLALSFANKYRFSGGAACGILTAAGVMLAMPDMAAGMVVFPAATMASALFMRFGKITQAAGFMLVMGIGISAIGINSNTLSAMTGAAAGSVLFILLPADTIAAKMRYRQTVINGADVSEIFAERLRLAGGALSDVKFAVEKAGEILDKRNIKDVSWIYNSAGDTVCRKCPHNMLCWGEEYNDTVAVFNKLVKRLRKGDTLSEKDLPPNIEKRCEKRRQLLYALSDRHREFVSLNSSNRKITEMRTVLTAQLGATENLMLDMSEEFRDYTHYDRVMAAHVERVLSENGITKPRAAVTVSEGRVSVEGYGNGKLTCDGEQLCDLISSALRKEFDLPEIINSGVGEFRFTMYERAVYGVEYGACQLSKSGEKSCGDYYDSFVDGKGFAYIILSDGMGSGSRARIDSAFACGMLVKLLRAGIGLPSSMEIINNSLLVKSSDESFATLDICRIDLYTGKTELFKAGAAPSYIRCNKRLVKASGKGLPVGIGYKAVFESQSFIIGNTDMIIMASDGAELNEKWLEHELTSKSFIDLNETAEHIAQTARYGTENTEQVSKGREDDISVIAVKLVK